MTRSKLISSALAVAALATMLAPALPAAADVNARPSPGEFGYSECWGESYWPEGSWSLVQPEAIDPFDMRTWPIIISGAEGWERIAPTDQRITWSTPTGPIDSALGLPSPSIAADGYALFSSHCLTPSQTPPRGTVLNHSLEARWLDGGEIGDAETGTTSASKSDQFTVEFSMTVATPPPTVVLDHLGRAIEFSARDLEFSGGAYNEASEIKPAILEMDGITSEGFACTGSEVQPGAASHGVTCSAVFELVGVNPAGVPGVSGTLWVQPQWTVPIRGHWADFDYAPGAPDIATRGWLFEASENEQPPVVTPEVPVEPEQVVEPESPAQPAESEVESAGPSAKPQIVELAETGADDRAEIGWVLGALFTGALLLVASRLRPATSRV